MRQSTKTVLIWLILIGTFVLLYRVFGGPSSGLTGDKLLWNWVRTLSRRLRAMNDKMTFLATTSKF